MHGLRGHANYRCNNGCGVTRRIVWDSLRNANQGWPPKPPNTAGPCVCGGTIVWTGSLS